MKNVPGKSEYSTNKRTDRPTDKQKYAFKRPMFLDCLSLKEGEEGASIKHTYIRPHKAVVAAAGTTNVWKS